jgi:hypothetical protein
MSSLIYIESCIFNPFHISFTITNSFDIHVFAVYDGSLRLKCDVTCAETRFRLYAQRTSPFKSARWWGRQFSRLLAAEVCGISGSNAGYTVFRGSVKGTGYPLHSPVSPLHFPSRASPCAITFQLESTLNKHFLSLSYVLIFHPLGFRNRFGGEGNLNETLKIGLFPPRKHKVLSQM